MGKKGGNNVSSLIYKHLIDNGYIELARTQGPGKRLCLIFDNCAGQNKNRMVVRFAQYLVHTSIFKEVEIIFLITGHIKNVCDRRFKDLKNNFHHRNVYSFEQLIGVMKEGKNNEINELRYMLVKAIAFTTGMSTLTGTISKIIRLYLDFTTLSSIVIM